VALDVKIITSTTDISTILKLRDCILILYILYLYILLESSPTGETINSLSAWKGIHILEFIPFLILYFLYRISACCILFKGFFVNVYLFIHYRGIILISGVLYLISVLYKQCLVPELGCEAVRLRPQRHRVVTVGISIYSMLDIIPSNILFLIVFIGIYT
jgi:hypothetical protein